MNAAVDPIAAGLLGMLAPESPQASGLFAQADWQAIGRMARDQRLGPVLHARWSTSDDVPAALRDEWQRAYRETAISALVQKQALVALADALTAAGIPALALKGAWLGWHAYPQAAERPLRDLDLLVEESHALAAWSVAMEMGFRPAEPVSLSLAEWSSCYKHLPVLRNSQGVLLEIHTRLWDRDARHPPPLEGIFERSVRDSQHPALTYPAPVDQFAHLVVHAVAGHQWDAGPLALLDIVRLAQTGLLDWQEVWDRAAQEGWARHAALVVTVTDRWIMPGLRERSGCPVSVPRELVDQAPALICKPQVMREPDRAALKASRGNLTDKIRRVAARRAHSGGPGSYARWIWAHLRGMSRIHASGDGRARLAAARTLDAWLAG